MHLVLCTHNTGYNQSQKTRFVAHFAVLKDVFCQPKKLRLDELWVLRLFSTTIFDLQISLFVITMKNNFKLVMRKSFDVNPLTKLQRTFFSSHICRKNP
jgi:hypothetical protein